MKGTRSYPLSYYHRSQNTYLPNTTITVVALFVGYGMNSYWTTIMIIVATSFIPTGLRLLTELLRHLPPPSYIYCRSCYILSLPGYDYYRSFTTIFTPAACRAMIIIVVATNFIPTGLRIISICYAIYIPTRQQFW